MTMADVWAVIEKLLRALWAYVTGGNLDGEDA